MSILIRYQRNGGYIHLFADGPGGGTVVVSLDRWPAFKKQMESAGGVELRSYEPLPPAVNDNRAPDDAA